MKQVRKKSADAAVNQMIIKAYRSQTELTWDRAEAMQPQCGFGRLSICCSDCYDGPCRVNPFATVEQRTICGRGQKELAAGYFLRKVTDGAAGLVQLAAEFGAPVSQDMWEAVVCSGDDMLAPTAGTERLAAAGRAAVQALAAIAEVKERMCDQAAPGVTQAGLGTLKAEMPNIVLHGHIAPQVVELLVQAAERSGTVNIVAMCGNELGAPHHLPALTNYQSQETPLLTGAVDLLIIGSQCVMPATLSLAEQLNVPVVKAAALRDAQAAAQAIAMAQEAFRRRNGRSVDIPAASAAVQAGFTANSAAVAAGLVKGYGQGIVRGAIYLGGCGQLAATQDAAIVQLAQELLADDYLVVTGGCAGVALAKAGLCRPDAAEGEALRSVLPHGVPAVLSIGSCHDAGEFLRLAGALQASGIPVTAVMPEVTHGKVLATAVGFAGQGIVTFLGLGEAAEVSGLYGEERLLPLTDLRQLPQALAEVAAAQ
ncbi:Prismane [Thermosinus carboxydivorans Nor1]|uniref:Prismane n=1 Tax=Thermosinus carboxydivorans Nor1 TaxID=401526 RepID=A1HNI2_9FIRM|nr:Prismane [Thermosinus carboxydivorans]EAX48341.1 Prismane [Thermosinus carboxydivorans Nor1]